MRSRFNLSSYRPRRAQNCTSRAQKALSAWHQKVKAARWRNSAEIRRTFPHADLIGDGIVFNVGGNHYRVIGRITYPARDDHRGIVYILAVMDHAECARGRWPEECGCHEPWPAAGESKPGGPSAPGTASRKRSGAMAGKLAEKSRAVPEAPRRRPAPAAPELPPNYFELVEQFPLTIIRDEPHLTRALKVINGLLRRERDEGMEAYLEVLTNLVESYEDEHHPIPAASEADVLQSLMEDHGLSQRALAGKVGIAQPIISAVLQGRRSLTKDQVAILAGYFGLSPSAFLGG